MGCLLEMFRFSFVLKGIGVGKSPAKRPRVSLDSLHSHPNQYFVYENEEYSRGIAIVDEDTIVYGSHDPNKKDEYYIVVNKNRRRFLSVLYVNEDGNAAPVDFDQEKVEILDTY